MALALCTAFPVAAAAGKNSKESKKIVEEVLAGVERLDSELESLSFDFVQTLRMTETGLEQSVEGKLRYQKPDRIRIDYLKPRVQEAYADSEFIQVYTPADNLVVRGDWKQWRKRQGGISHLLQFGDYAKLLRRHKIEVSSYEVPGSTESWYDVELIPKKKKDRIYSLRILFAKDTFLPRRTELMIEESRFIVELNNVKKNPKFKKGIFDFVAPAGAQVVEFPGLSR